MKINTSFCIQGINYQNNNHTVISKISTNNISFSGLKSKQLQDGLKVLGNYNKTQLEIKTVIKSFKTFKDGSVAKYLSDGSTIVESSKQAEKQLKSKITSNITKTKEWKSNPKRDSFEQACVHEASRSSGTSGIKRIEHGTPEGEFYLSKGCTHEVKVKSDYRMFGKQLPDGSYECSLFEHSKMH